MAEKAGKKNPLGKTFPWINIHPNLLQPAEGREGIFHGLHLGFLDYPISQNASIKCSGAKFLAGFPKVGQGNGNKTIQGDLLK